MERNLSVEERIKRAERIYAEKNNNVNVNRNDFTKKSNKIKKIFFQVLICFFIYTYFYISKSYGNTIPEKITDILKNDTSDYTTVTSTFYNVKEKIISIVDKIKNVEEESLKIEDTIENDIVEENIKEENSNENIEVVENTSKFIWPLNGVITSKFGEREATNIVSANHHGIDIAGNIGDEIIASSSGTVVVANEIESYGKYIEIQDGEYKTLYAHCNEILVNEGDQINQGMLIAKVGNTRESNRSAFTF